MTMKAKRSSRSTKKKSVRKSVTARRSSARPSSRAAGNLKRETGNRPLISTVIFDLDDTLYDCFRQRVQLAHRHAAQAMVDAGVKASAAEIFKVRMAAFKKDPHLKFIDDAVCRRFKVANP